MNPKTMQRLEKLLETFDSGAVQPEELIQAIDAVMAIVKQSNETIAKKVGDNDTATKERIKMLENEVDQALRRLEAYSTRLNSDKATKADVERLQANLASEIKRVSSLIPELPPEFDASDIYTTIEGHKAIIDSISTLIIGENLRNALEALPDGEKLAIEAVEGLREELDRIAKDWRKGGSGGGLGSQIVLDIINQAIADGTIPSGSLPPGGTTGQVLRKQSNADGDADWETIAGTGIVQTIVAGTGISVDDTDPANPIVTATGGGSGLTRSIATITTPTTAGATALTDYIFFINNTTLTLPTAVSNTNRYTVKCISGTCVVEADGSETIDGINTIGIQVEDSVDLISNNTEWKVV